MRHEQTTTAPAAADALADVLSPHTTMLLTTFRKDGTPGCSPVSVAVDDGRRIFFRSYAETWKAKRLRRDPRALVTPSTLRGRPIGPTLPARARLLDGEEAATARRLLARRYPVLHGIAVPLAHRIAGYHTVHYELLPESP